MDDRKSLSERADELEEYQMQKLENLIVTRSLLYQLGDGEQPQFKRRPPQPGRRLLMGEDPRLPKMPDNRPLRILLNCVFLLVVSSICCKVRDLHEIRDYQKKLFLLV